MGSSRRSVSVFSMAAEALLHALVFVIPFSFGGAAPWVVWPLTLLSTAALATAIVGARRQRQDLLFAPGAAVPLLFAAACLVQLIPLPDGLLRALSGPAAELEAFALIPLGLDRARPISMDPPSTWRELSKSVSYLFILAAAVQLSRSRTVRRRLLASVALCGVAMALIGLGHRLFEVDKLFGVHTWQYAGPRIVTPFANHNHLAGFLTLTGTVALGLAATARERSRSLLWVLGFVTAAAATVFSTSRGGMMSFVAAALIFAAFLVRQRVASKSSGERSWVVTAIPIAALVAALAVGGLIAYESTSERLATVSSLERISRTKVELWPMFMEGARPFGFLGMGRGAFELAFTPYQTQLPGVIFTHPENAVLQLWAELGVPLALAVLALGGLALLRILRRSDSHGLELAAVAAVAGVVLHDMFDFALELPATAVAASLVLGTASRGEKDEGLRLPVMLAGPAGLALFVLALLGAVFSHPTFQDAEAELAALVKKRAPPAEVNALAKKLVDRHPADYALYALAARAHSRKEGDPQEALAWVNRVLILHPLDAGAHMDAARALLKLGKRSQALLEYRLAGEAGMGNIAISEGLKYARTVDEALQLVDMNPAPLRVLVETLYGVGRPADGDAALARGLTEFGERKDASGLWLLKASRRAEARDFDGALAGIAEAEKRGADPLSSARTRAQILSAAGKPDEALSVLQAQVASNAEDVELAFAIASLLQQQGRTRQAREALTRASPFITEPATRARLMTAEAGLYEAEGALQRAISSYQSAARLMPGVSTPHYSAAQLYERLGKFDAAAREVHEGIRIDGPGAEKAHAAWLERLGEAQKKQVEQ